jgi:outer membrane usher protein PapC
MLLRPQKLSFFACSIALGSICFGCNVYAVEFNTDVLDAEDKKNIDLSKFSQSGYINPGQYQMRIAVNGQTISPSEIAVVFKETKDETGKSTLSRPCLTAETVELIGFTLGSLGKITYETENKCANFSKLSGIELRPNQGEGVLNVIIPTALLEYSDASWLPPSRWENGIPGILLDYNLNGYVNDPQQGNKTQSLSYNGTTGANLGAWRFRADYQGSMMRTDGDDQGTENDFDWQRIYMYRAIHRLESKLKLGENYITSGIFDSWRYTGVSLESDDRMLPPKLRDFAPQVSGVAETNARVVVSHQGRILYDTTVPAGPFTIQDLDGSVRGRLDVEITEQNGKKRIFQVEAGYVPYLTRPGKLQYKLYGGRPMESEGHSTKGPTFLSGEVSWGANNRWSPYGGLTLSEDYNAGALGAAVNLDLFGVISTDVTQSSAKFSQNDNPDSEDTSLSGKSFRVAYFKRFEDADADISFAGYRFSDEEYMSMQQFLDASYLDDFSGRQKELVTVTLNKRFEEAQLGISLQYNYQTYWDEDSTSYYTLTVDRYFDAFGFRNISAGISASRSEFEGETDDSVYLRFSIPWGTAMLSYNGSSNNGRYGHTVGYSDTLNNGLDSYNINAGIEHGDDRASQAQLSAYYSHRGRAATVSANAAKVENSYTSYGFTATGGATVTAKGAALHAGGMNGGTRMLVDTDGIAGVPVDNGRTTTNRWGVGVVTDMSSYYRTTTSVDMNNLPKDMEATHSVVESALTEGAIGYREFDILKGVRLFAVIKQEGNSNPPFGASVTNEKGRELGMVGEDGLAWLSGVAPGEKLNVSWDAKIQCSVEIPEKVDSEQQLLLPCRK